MKERDTSIDTLRTLAALLVIIVHISAPYISNAIHNDSYDITFKTAVFFDSFSRCCVPIFVMISGKYLLMKEDSIMDFYKKRISKIFVPLLFWGLLYSLFSILVNYLLYKELNIINVSINFLSGKPYAHLWYLYMLLGLYFIIPIINKCIYNLSIKNIKTISYCFLLFGFVFNLYNYIYRIDQLFLIWFLEYIGYLMLGYVLTKSPIRINTNLLLVIFIMSSTTIGLLTTYSIKNFNSLYFFEYMSPFVIISTISLYQLFLNINLTPNLFSKLAKFSFGIYLMHAGILFVFSFILEQLPIKVPIFGAFLIKIFVVFTTSLFAAVIFKKVNLLKNTI